jgi:hypothetical protein
MKRFNNFIADKMASLMATMLLFWILLILDVAGAIVDPPSNIQGWLLWGVSILFQSVALPVLALVSNKQGDRMETKLDQTHDASVEILAEVHEIVSELHDHHIGGREHKKVR